MDRPHLFLYLLIEFFKILLLLQSCTVIVQGKALDYPQNQQQQQQASLSSTAVATTLLQQQQQHQKRQQKAYFEPALIGFRCEGASEQTLDGISVIEANAPVKLILFGEAFTTETIVAFTTEFVHKSDLVDKVVSSNLGLNTKTAAAKSSGIANGQLIATSPASARSTSSTPTNLRGGNQLQEEEASALQEFTENNSTESIATTRSKKFLNIEIPSSEATKLEEEEEEEAAVAEKLIQRDNNKNEKFDKLREKKFKRRLLSRQSYDCTDHDRVISYKLTEDNIITPNVAVLTVRLPELAWTSSGVYYHFCLKQPPIPSEFILEQQQQAINDNYLIDNDYANSSNVNLTNSLSSSGGGGGEVITSKLTPQFVWVHQGDEWWLTLKVEPPILSVTNDCFLIVLLLFLSAVTSGLNLGLMSLDMNELAVISSCGDQRERSYARTIAPLRKRGNYLLCSLLLGNVMVNSTLTVILEEMTSGVVAVIGSTLAIVVLGEIVPQAFCARQGLAIGAKTIYLTYAFMILTFPLSYPISCLLDCILGEEKGNVYDRERLMEFIRITGNHTQLEADEVAIISGALKLKKIRVEQIMTRIEDVFMLPVDCMLNRDTIKSIIEKGYSRIPVYEFNDRKQIVALILAKDLALLDPDDQVPLANMLMYCKHPLIFIEDTATLDVALNEFKTGKSHMAIVRQIYDDGEVDKYYEAIGVVTLEDVIEEVLQTEINDETDTLSDNRRKRRRTDAQVAHLADNLSQQQLTPTLSLTTNTSNCNTVQTPNTVTKF